MRLTLKLSIGGRLLVEHIELLAPVTEERFRSLAQELSQVLGGPVQPHVDPENEGDVE